MSEISREQSVAGARQSVEFLRRLRPDGAWKLTSIVPDGKTTTKTFSPQNAQECEDWILRRQGKENIYYEVNRSAGRADVKSQKAEMTEAMAMYVDVDTRPESNRDRERSRILEALREMTPPPTLIVDSGNGYQALWILNQAIPIQDERERLTYEAKNMALEEKLGADRTHNADRILRLPGTINVPNQRKLRVGRSAELSTVVEWHEERTYGYSVFAPAIREVRRQRSGHFRPELTHPIPPKVSLDNLSENVRSSTKVLILQGHDPTDPSRFPSRSEALFCAVCDLIRAEVSDEVIASIIMDPEYGISASVIEKSDPRAYAGRQIASAHEKVESPELHELNMKYFVVAHAGQVRVCWFEQDEECKSRFMLQRIGVSDFKTLFSNRSVEENKRTRALGDWWLRHPRRREYQGLVFLPGRPEEVERKLNLWRGFGVEPARGDWSLMRAHIRDVICSGSEDEYQYLLKWMAWSVQNPALRTETAIVLRGKQGTGKGVLARALRDIFGQHAMHVNSGAMITGRFNGHMRDCCFLYADEAVAAESNDARNRLKALITEDQIAIERKGADVEMVTNRLKLMMSTNEQWAAAVDPDDRRFVVLDVSEARANDQVYFDELSRQLKAGGLKAMLFDLLEMDLGTWHPRQDLPRGKAMDEQRIYSLRGVAKAWFELLYHGEIPGTMAKKRVGGDIVLKMQQFSAFIRVLDPKTHLSPRLVRAELKKMGVEQECRDSNNRGLIVPPLESARKSFAEFLRLQNLDWPDHQDWSVPRDPADPGVDF